MGQISNQQYLAGVATMKEGARLAIALGNHLRAGRFYNAAGSAHLLAFGFRDAMDCLRLALSQARLALNSRARLTPKEREAAQDLIAAASVNLASLYLEMDDPESAGHLLLEASADLRPQHPFEPQLLILRARVREQNSDHAGALDLLSRAVDAADRQLNWRTLAFALYWRGVILARLRRLEEAEACFLEAYRQRVIHRMSAREAALRRLALFELERGNAARAHSYILAAEQRQRKKYGEEVDWKTNTILGRVLQALGQNKQALQAYRRAAEEAARWRSALIPSFAVMAESDVTTSELALRYAALAARMADSTGSSQLAAESLLAVVRHRASSLLRLQSRHAANTALGPEYRALVSRLRRIEMSARPEDESARTILRRQAADMETKILPGFDFGRTGPSTDAALMRSLRAALPKGSVAIVFLVGPERSWRWVVGRDTLQLKQLPPRERIEAAIDRLRGSLSETERASAGKMLLSGLPPEALAAGHWFLSLDGPLFDVPFSTLTLPGEHEQPLLSGRSVQIVPYLLSLLEPARRWKPGPLLAVADPVYNRADPRFTKRDRSRIPLLLGSWSDQSSPAARKERPRLAASRVEAQTVGAFWKGLGHPARFLTGEAVEASAMAESLSTNPSVIHLATHVELRSEGLSGEFVPLDLSSSIALSIHPDGTADTLRPEALMRLQLPASIVVMSGCDSGRGRVRAGLGLTGLSRAWLIGGASAVVGSLWPVRDGASPLFVSFYRALAEGRTPAQALRQAQLNAIRAGGWQADPSYWGAWTLTGR